MVHPNPDRAMLARCRGEIVEQGGKGRSGLGGDCTCGGHCGRAHGISTIPYHHTSHGAAHSRGNRRRKGWGLRHLSVRFKIRRRSFGPHHPSCVRPWIGCAQPEIDAVLLDSARSRALTWCSVRTCVCARVHARHVCVCAPAPAPARCVCVRALRDPLRVACRRRQHSSKR